MNELIVAKNCYDGLVFRVEMITITNQKKEPNPKQNNKANKTKKR